MTVGELRKSLEGIPDDMTVLNTCHTLDADWCPVDIESAEPTKLEDIGRLTCGRYWPQDVLFFLITS